jgi:hypothetical protein
VASENNKILDMVKMNIFFIFSILISIVCSAKQNADPIIHDITVNGKIKLRNSFSIEKNLGDVMSKLNSDKDLPDVYFKNKSGTEYLRLVFFSGDTKNIISLFEVSKIGLISKPPKIYQSVFPYFFTESGIKLEMTMSDVVGKKGNKFKKTSKGELIVLKYRINYETNPKFLTAYNMPLYIAEYTFKNGVLVKFIFGFEYS